LKTGKKRGGVGRGSKTKRPGTQRIGGYQGLAQKPPVEQGNKAVAKQKRAKKKVVGGLK